MSDPQVTVCIDNGNSSMKVAAFRGEVLVGMERDYSTEAVQFTNHEHLVRRAIEDAATVRCVVSCRKSEYCRKYVSDFISWIGKVGDVAWLDADSQIPFAMNYTEGRPGSDRIANVFALRKLAPNNPAVVVDFGTSTHIESTDAHGDFAGGLIMIGLGESRRALGEATRGAALNGFDPDKTDDDSRKIFAFSTYDSVNNGLLLQQTAAVEHFFTQARERFPETQFFATGGAAEYILPFLETEVRHVDELTMIGLREFAYYHFKTLNEQRVNE